MKRWKLVARFNPQIHHQTAKPNEYEAKQTHTHTHTHTHEIVWSLQPNCHGFFSSLQSLLFSVRFPGRSDIGRLDRSPCGALSGAPSIAFLSSTSSKFPYDPSLPAFLVSNFRFVLWNLISWKFIHISSLRRFWKVLHEFKMRYIYDLTNWFWNSKGIIRNGVIGRFKL